MEKTPLAQKRIKGSDLSRTSNTKGSDEERGNERLQNVQGEYRWKSGPRSKKAVNYIKVFNSNKIFIFNTVSI